MTEGQVISITGFEPLQIAVPKCKQFVGTVRIELPAVHLKVYDLSLAGLLPGAHIGADASILALTLNLAEPGITDADMMKFIIEAQEELAAAWRAAQQFLDDRGALLG